jgi:hypothetical protein
MDQFLIKILIKLIRETVTRGCYKNAVKTKGKTTIGFLEEKQYDLDYEIVVVKILSSIGAQKAVLHQALSFVLHCMVLAVGHTYKS